jgi:hypothetical protein
MFKTHRKDCTFFDFTGSHQQNTPTQIENFLEQIFTWFNKEPKQKKDIKTWSSAFNFLKRVLAEKLQEEPTKKIVLFFDEVPWVDRSNKAGYLSALGYFWNTFCETHSNFLVIVCGSNASWIKKKLLNENVGSFSHRIDKTIPMYPFDLKETSEYLRVEKKMEIDDKSVLELYMIFGGVAKYLSYIDKDLDIDENISEIFFNINGRMFNEYQEVFKSLFASNVTRYKKIMDFLSSKKSGYNVTKIAQHLNISIGSTITDTLDDLVECGFIKPIATLGSKGEDLYVVSDPYCLFYNDWLRGISKNKIISLPSSYWSEQTKKSKYTTWSGFAFEVASILNIHLYLKARGKSAIVKNVYSWNYKKVEESSAGKGAQIDLVVEYENSSYDLVECKYYKKLYSMTEVEKNKILNKKEMFKKYVIGKKVKYKIDIVMLSAFGCVKNNKNYKSLGIQKDMTLQDLLS